MKKVFLLVSLAVVLGLVLVGCPQPTDSGSDGNGGGTSESVFEDYTTGAETASIGMKAIPGGDYAYQGSEDTTVANFYLGETEVTQEQWFEVMETRPSNFDTAENLPVEQVSWYDAIEFCNALTIADLTKEDVVYTIVKSDENDQDKWTVTADYTKSGYRLPTEKEWEYAAGGGQSDARTIYAAPITVDSTLDGIDDNDDTKKLIDYAWYVSNANNTTHIVGTAGTESSTTPKSGKANALGLYDMSGNVWEWCYETYSDGGSIRVFRGGSWFDLASDCRVANRNGGSPSGRYSSRGLRVARSL